MIAQILLYLSQLEVVKRQVANVVTKLVAKSLVGYSDSKLMRLGTI